MVIGIGEFMRLVGEWHDLCIGVWLNALWAGVGYLVVHVGGASQRPGRGIQEGHQTGTPLRLGCEVTPARCTPQALAYAPLRGYDHPKPMCV